MKNQRIHTRKQRIDALFSLGKSLNTPGISLEAQAHWARYLCVLVSGFIETSVRDVFDEFASSRSDERVRRYVSKTIEKNRRNMKSSAVIELTEQFDSLWAKNLKNYLEDNGRKEAFDSVVDVRNRIVHGEDSTISYAIIRDYYDRIVEVVDFLEGQCVP